MAPQFVIHTSSPISANSQRRPKVGQARFSWLGEQVGLDGDVRISFFWFTLVLVCAAFRIFYRVPSHCHWAITDYYY